MNMKEFLDSLSLAFDTLNEEKRNIEEKEVKTQADLDELEEINNFFKKIDERRSSWMTEKEGNLNEIPERETMMNQSSLFDFAGENYDSIYRDREEVFDFSDSSANEPEPEKVTEESTDRFEQVNQWIEEKIAQENSVSGQQQSEEPTNRFEQVNQFITEGIKEEQPQNTKEEPMNSLEHFNTFINNGNQEEQVESIKRELSVIDEELYNSNIDNMESIELAAWQNPEEDYVDYEVPTETDEADYAVRLREFIESEANEKKKNPIKNFVTNIRKRIKPSKKLNKKEVGIGILNFIKNIPTKRNKRHKDSLNNTESNVNNNYGYNVNYEYGYSDDDFTYQTVDEQNYGIGEIGSTITVYSGTKLHNNAFDAYFGKNGYPAYYNNDEERVVIGVAIVNDNGMTSVYASDSNYNQKINELMQNGGEIVSLLTANKKYLSDWDGITPLNWDEIRAYKEGWYNINDVANKNKKGIQR